MGILRWLIDNSDYGVEIEQSSKDRRWYWILRDGTGKPRAIPTAFGSHHGFETAEACEADARDVVEGLGARFGALDVIKEPA